MCIKTVLAREISSGTPPECIAAIDFVFAARTMNPNEKSRLTPSLIRSSSFRLPRVRC